MIGKPVNESPLELLARSADCAAVICIGHFPQAKGWIVGCNPAGMTNRDVPIVLPVNQQNWNPSCRHYSLRGNLMIASDSSSTLARGLGEPSWPRCRVRIWLCQMEVQAELRTACLQQLPLRKVHRDTLGHRPLIPNQKCSVPLPATKPSVSHRPDQPQGGGHAVLRSFPEVNLSR
jgi:hypothetical protein